ncbi:MAG: cytochrome c biogenesis protein CcsA [Flavobacteriales bacterium]
MEYVGEWTAAAWAGRALVAIGFGAALVATGAYVRKEERIGRWAFRIHSVAMLATIALIFVLFAGHRYEFNYIWKHLSNAMPMRFILSAFWGGQEGGFLLWMFWHIVLAFFVMRRPTAWTVPVMAVLSGIEAFLTSMLLGVYFGDFQLGLDPFILLRELPENIGLPWTSRPDYLTAFPLFADGQGLNPLLQNYWMTIHPPTLFLGFAAVSIPFAFAAAGLQNREDRSWIRPALRWSIFAVGTLGTGILMGGAWAYEALSFGGFWAWDPVENSSLVPWLVSVAGAHLLLINRNRRKATGLFSTTYFPMLAFLLVLYSTFLTKSGILGDTSVHSFVDSGILPQLLAYVLTFATLAHALLLREPAWRWGIAAGAAVAVAAMVKGWAAEGMWGLFVLWTVAAVVAYRKEFRTAGEAEDALWTRDFWMFVGSLLLLLSALHITWQTSIPVFNALLAPFSGAFQWAGEQWGSELLIELAQHDLAPSTDFELAYHRVQVPLAVLVMLIVGMAQWLRYGSTPNPARIFRRLGWMALVAAGLTAAFLLFEDVAWWEAPRVALLFAALFAAVAQIDYFRVLGRAVWTSWGSPLAHLGFALVIFGAVYSTSRKEVISRNVIGDLTSLSEELNNREDILMMQGDTLPIGPYFASYRDKVTEGIHVRFQVDYFDRIPRRWKPGEVAYYEGMVFEAKEEHTASDEFERDMERYWTFVPFPNARQSRDAVRWTAGAPGPFLFTLEPRIQLNEQMGNAPEPDTRHSAFKDLYTHIKWGRVTPPETDEDGWMGGSSEVVVPGDSILAGRILLVLDSLRPIRDDERPDRGLLDRDIALAACFSLRDRDKEGAAEPLYIVRDSLIIPDMHEPEGWGIRLRIDAFDPATEAVTLSLWEHESVRRDFIVMQAVVFPHINILWLGCVLMAMGSGLAVWARWKRERVP